MNAIAIRGLSSILVLLLELSTQAQSSGLPLLSRAPTNTTPAATEVEIRSLEGTNLWISPRGATDWVPVSAQLRSLRTGDRGRTGRGTRLTLQLHSKSVIRIQENTEFQIDPPATSSDSWWIMIRRGASYFFHRGEPNDLRIRSGIASAAVRGTELLVTVQSDGTTALSVLEGSAWLSNRLGGISLGQGELGLADASAPPTKPPLPPIRRGIQWCLHYPAILDVAELPASPVEGSSWADSARAYQRGDLPQALAKYPWDTSPATPAEALYAAALQLSVGSVAASLVLPAEPEAGSPPSPHYAELVAALRLMVEIITHPTEVHPKLSWDSATGWMAESYRRQAAFDLEGALEAARHAVERSPSFGFGWARLAELEFSRGRTANCREALRKALGEAPQHAEALMLTGFLEAADRRSEQAMARFTEAIQMDGALGEAWLGRGLVQLQKGRRQEGLRDLMIAAALEPQRAILRSYLAKAFDAVGDTVRAEHELRLAMALDPSDPTPWLYHALLLRDQHALNPAIRSLDQSVARNGNRRVYRSRLLLDQDQAVRGTQLASIYVENGLPELGIRHASRAVAADYASFSAHQFLSDSYNTLRDPRRLQLRYETPWRNEQLIAQMLAPVGSGAQSQDVSFQEYNRLFEFDGLGLSSFSEYWSGRAFREALSHFGSFGPDAYAVDLEYYMQDGYRPNQDMERREWAVHWKHQFTSQDGLLAQMRYKEQFSGDLRTYEPTALDFDRDYRLHETQDPTWLVGYHRQWRPDVHTLLLAGFLENHQQITDESRVFPSLDVGPGGVGAIIPNTIADLNYENRYRVWLAEINQVIQGDRSRVILGSRAYRGEIDFANRVDLRYVRGAGGSTNAFATARTPDEVRRRLDEPLERTSAYGYWTVTPWDPLALTAGVSWDRLSYPEHFLSPPVAGGRIGQTRLSPKVALEWQPRPEVSLRGAYARSLGGAGFEENVRLEPTQLAGVIQSYRSILPESVTGSLPGERMSTTGAVLEWRVTDQQFLVFESGYLTSEGRQSVGVYRDDGATNQISHARNDIRFREWSGELGYSALLGDQWSLALGQRLTRAILEQEFPTAEPTLLPPTTRLRQASARVWHSSARLQFNHPAGWFGRVEIHGYLPDHSDPAARDDAFEHVHAWMGYRLGRQKGEITLGLLNLTDRSRALSALLPDREPPIRRTFYAALRLNF